MVDEQKISDIEELAAQELLIELINKKKAEIFENVVFEGKRRYYIEDLNVRDYFLENTTPYQFEIFDTIIQESSWGGLLCKVVNLCAKKSPRPTEELLGFKVQWTKAVIFAEEEKTNYRLIEIGVYLNCNHTALHSCWLLQDILDFYNIDKNSVTLLIHRPCSAEPKKVKEYILKRFKNGFSDFLVTKHKVNEQTSQKVFVNIDKHLNPLLSKVSKSYTNFFLFDDNTTLSNYVKKVRELISKSKYEEQSKKVLNTYLDFLLEYYKES